MAIEIDGTLYHAEGSRQAERDAMKKQRFVKVQHSFASHLYK